MTMKKVRFFMNLPKELNECSHCHLVLPVSEFRPRKELKSGLRSRCRECEKIQWQESHKSNREYRNAKGKEWRSQNRKKVAKIARKTYLKATYNLSPEEYDSMYIEQGGRCAICGKHQSEFKKRLHVDHCHETETNRGLLCRSCNLLLGHSNDNTEILMNAIKYLGNSNGDN